MTPPAFFRRGFPEGSKEAARELLVVVCGSVAGWTSSDLAWEVLSVVGGSVAGHRPRVLELELDHQRLQLRVLRLACHHRLCGVRDSSQFQIIPFAGEDMYGGTNFPACHLLD